MRHRLDASSLGLYEDVTERALDLEAEGSVFRLIRETLSMSIRHTPSRNYVEPRLCGSEGS